jgi:hypothetical protein
LNATRRLISEEDIEVEFEGTGASEGAGVE